MKQLIPKLITLVLMFLMLSAIIPSGIIEFDSEPQDDPISDNWNDYNLRWSSSYSEKKPS